MRKQIVLFLFAIVCIPAKASDVPLKLGNFSLPNSQRPGAIYSFGSRILGKGEIQGKTKAEIFEETGARFVGLPTKLLFGTSEDTSLLFTLPVNLDVRLRTPTGTTHAAGFGNAGLQGEYRFYHPTSLTDEQSAALLLGFSSPTGAKDVSDPSSTFFVGGTYSHTWADWLWFVAPGYLMFAGDHPIRPGNIFYYEFGAGRMLDSKTDEFIFEGFLEFNGQYDAKAHGLNHGAVLSDGFLLFLTPSLFYSTPHWIVATGVSVPIAQYWRATNERVDYYATVSVDYTWF